ncbi:MAG: SDR family NAD(P)-dependent oxidoreductase, partial [Deltaproteobacteria bacterium]
MTTDMQARVTGWVVAITGANRGIGRALASAFSEAGATVLAHARDEAAARAVVDALP